MDKLKVEIQEQQEFVEWLTKKGIYNPMCSANVMERMFCVYKSKDEEIKKLRAERDSAIAHDTQPYPTALAYETVCKLLEESKAKNKSQKEILEQSIEDQRDTIELLNNGNLRLRSEKSKLREFLSDHIKDLIENHARSMEIEYFQQALKDGD